MAASAAQSVAELLELARGGDQQSLDRLFQLCRSYVDIAAQAQVESWLQAKVDASDLVQQTLLEAYRGFGNFRGQTEAEWLAWLRRILRHNATDFIRQFHGTDKRQVHRERSLQPVGSGSRIEAGIEPTFTGDSPSEMLIRKERELQVADALTRLSPEHREVILLRNLQRLPFEEVAQRMNRTRPAVQMLWMRAIHKLQEIITNDW
jgi:RNA polymerase sigma-70 factor (ECF subfamily)